MLNLPNPNLNLTDKKESKSVLLENIQSALKQDKDFIEQVYLSLDGIYTLLKEFDKLEIFKNLNSQEESAINMMSALKEKVQEYQGYFKELNQVLGDSESNLNQSLNQIDLKIKELERELNNRKTLLQTELNIDFENFKSQNLEKLKTLIEENKQELLKVLSAFKTESLENLENSKNSALNALNSTKSTALSELNTLKQEITQNKQDALSELTQDKQDAINSLNALKSESLENLENSKNSALSALNSTKNSTLSELNTLKQEITQNKQDAINAITHDKQDSLSALNALKVESLENLAQTQSQGLERLEQTKTQALNALESIKTNAETIANNALEIANNNARSLSALEGVNMKFIGVFINGEQKLYVNKTNNFNEIFAFNDLTLKSDTSYYLSFLLPYQVSVSSQYENNMGEFILGLKSDNIVYPILSSFQSAKSTLVFNNTRIDNYFVRVAFKTPANANHLTLGFFARQVNSLWINVNFTGNTDGLGDNYVNHSVFNAFQVRAIAPDYNNNNAYNKSTHCVVYEILD
ncbi:hypothetical protein [Helicobacter cetorum]|uniref:hypothetical protein n=1 Tax=Helicobacter cetorum TaxID=138563 RepID=UPI000CF1BE32|nr:hypothetical protein [Helicobacter cetorum]